MVVCGIAITPQASYAAPASSGRTSPVTAVAAKAPAADQIRGVHKKARKKSVKADPGTSASPRPTATAPRKTGYLKLRNRLELPGKTAAPRRTATPIRTTAPSKPATPGKTPTPGETPTPGRTGTPHQLDAAVGPAANAHAEPTPGVPTLTAAWTDASVVDHQYTVLALTLTRSDNAMPLAGLGYQIALPTHLFVYDTVGTNTCGGVVTAGIGATSITLASGLIAMGLLTCVLQVKVATEYSGSYTVSSTSASGLSSGMVNAITGQTLTVAPALPTLDASFTPDTISVGGTSTLSLYIQRTDHTMSSTATGLGMTVRLPTDVQVGAAATTSTCAGGIVDAARGAEAFTISGVSMVGGPGNCTITIPMLALGAGDKNINDRDASNVVGMTVHLEGVCAEASHAASDGCPAALHVNPIPQTITFAQPVAMRVSRETWTPGATASSGLDVEYTSGTSLVCTVSGTTVHLLAAGDCTITAHQAGDDNYTMAPTVTRTFTVNPPTPPPADVTATAGVSAITVHWSAPSDVTGLTGYTAIASPGPARCTTTGTLTCVMGGTANVTYTVTVVADNPDGDSAPAGPSNEVTPTGPPVTDTPPTTDLNLTTDKGLITTAVPNQDIIVIGTGFAAYSTATIVIYSTPIVLGTVITDGLGNFSKPVTIPTSLTVGQHTMIAAGVDPQGAPHSLHLLVTLHATLAGAGGTGGSLAVTGQATDLLFLIGLAATCGGTGLVFAGRRRRVTA